MADVIIDLDKDGGKEHWLEQASEKKKQDTEMKSLEAKAKFKKEYLERYKAKKGKK